MSLPQVENSRPVGLPFAAAKRPAFKLKSVILPNEHGSWGILFEPLVAAAAVAYSPAAAFVCLMFIGGFLIRQPLKIWIADRVAKRSRPQTEAARKYLLIYSAAAFVGLAGTMAIGGIGCLIPIAIAAPLALVQIAYDARGKSRRLIPEMLGASALTSSAAVLALAAGLTPASAASLALVFVLRSIPSFLYVRERIHLDKGKPYSFILPTTAHALALLTVAILALNGLASHVVVPIFAVLLFREAMGLSRYRQTMKAMQIGILEVIYGAAVVVAVIIGHYAGI